jgi:hypothetical protein
MPLSKLTFARLVPLDPSQATSLAQRLPRTAFEHGQGTKVIAVDRRGERLSVQLVNRRLREGQRYNEAENKMVAEQIANDREVFFNIDFAGGMAETPGSRRDFTLLLDAFKRSGAGTELEAQPIVVDIFPWAKEVLKMYETAQLANLVIDNYYVEPRLIGRYSAKAVDNRIDLAYLEEKAASLRSLRLGFFHEGLRRSVEARADGVLAVSSGEEEDLEHFVSEQRQILLKHSAG